MRMTFATAKEEAAFRRTIPQKFHGEFRKFITIFCFALAGGLVILNLIERPAEHVLTKDEYVAKLNAATQCMRKSGKWFSAYAAQDQGMGRYALQEWHGDTAFVCKTDGRGGVLTFSRVQEK